MIKHVHVPASNIPDVLPLVMDTLVAMAAAEMEMPLEDLLSELCTDRLQLHLGWDDDTARVHGVMLSTIEVSGFGQRTLYIRAARGSGAAQWFDDYDTLERWAVEYAKCEMLRVRGRLGWKKYLDREGFDLREAIFEKPLEI